MWQTCGEKAVCKLRQRAPMLLDEMTDQRSQPRRQAHAGVSQTCGGIALKSPQEGPSNGESRLEWFKKQAPPQCFPRAVRLLKHSDFERVYKQGKRHFSPHFAVYYLRRENGAGARIGFTVGKVLGGAVQRNRMKRRLRETVRRQISLLGGVAADVVIHPKKTVLTMEFKTLLEEVGRAFEVVLRKIS
jgi:ribonuclease P protein component